jgi:hypothetical protein
MQERVHVKKGRGLNNTLLCVCSHEAASILVNLASHNEPQQLTFCLQASASYQLSRCLIAPNKQKLSSPAHTIKKI